MKFHPAAAMFPMMRGDELGALVEDIRANGLIEPIWTFEGQILDGRNRSIACGIAGVEPIYRPWMGTEPLGFVISENLRRRHLDAGRRAAIAVRRRQGKDSILDRCEADAKERQRLRGKGKKKVSDLGQARHMAALIFQVNELYIQDAKRVREADPNLLERVIEGEVTLQEALDELAKRKRQQKRADLTETIEAQDLPDRQYPILLADPPWRYEYAETERRAIENQYPTLDLEELCNLKDPAGRKVQELPLDDAVLFLWATSPKLQQAFEVIEAWGFEYRTSMVWVKDKIGMGYYARQQHELLLIAKRGELPVPDPKTRPASVIEGPRGKHSKKPSVVYELIDRMYPGLPKVELFARNLEREGWASWGNQV